MFRIVRFFVGYTVSALLAIGVVAWMWVNRPATLKEVLSDIREVPDWFDQIGTPDQWVVLIQAVFNEVGLVIGGITLILRALFFIGSGLLIGHTLGFIWMGMMRYARRLLWSLLFGVILFIVLYKWWAKPLTIIAGFYVDIVAWLLPVVRTNLSVPDDKYLVLTQLLYGGGAGFALLTLVLVCRLQFLFLPEDRADKIAP